MCWPCSGRPPPDDPPPATEPTLLYSIAYAYDQLGNRRVKTEAVADRTTFYQYDVHEDPIFFSSHNNRLQWYRVYDGTLTTEPDPATASESVMYKYDAGGHPSTIVKKISGDATYRALRMTYDTSGRLWLAESYQWQVNQGSGNFTNVTRTDVREFRYDGGGRARYLMQDRDPVTLDVLPGTTRWTHYDDESPYSDYQINAANDGFTGLAMYLSGVAQLDAAATTPEYFHSDQIGTTRAMTDDTAAFTREVIYTAFGEPVSASGTSETRYGFVGQHGYEDGLIPGWGFVHVGARWYDPATGRFLQRDPIGILGGINVYAYARGLPGWLIDPSGEGPRWDRFKKKVKRGCQKVKRGAKKTWEVVKRLPSYVLPSSPVPADAAPDIANAWMRDALRRHILKEHLDNPEPNPKCPACQKLGPKPTHPPRSEE